MPPVVSHQQTVTTYKGIRAHLHTFRKADSDRWHWRWHGAKEDGTVEGYGGWDRGQDYASRSDADFAMTADFHEWADFFFD